MRMKKGGIVGFIVLLLIGMVTVPVLGGSMEADAVDDVVTIDVIDNIGGKPVKMEFSLSAAEWMALRSELRELRTADIPMGVSLEAQFAVLHEYGLVSDLFSYEYLRQRAEERVLPRSGRVAQLLNNSNFNAMCVINFELINGSTFVFGLNTFINFIGFDIFSVHKGYAVDGIETKGLFSKTTPPGDYIGTMFGFFGAWIGEQTGTGFYSNVTIAGFSVITGWVTLPLFPS